MLTIFTKLLLSDTINRATPKTQSALLEAMQEKTVTVGKNTYKLPKPFMVLATQNPIENEGTYPLPEAQLDRFLFKIKVDFPSAQELKEIMNITVTNHKIEMKPILTGEEIVEMRSLIKEMPMADPVQDYAISLVVKTHPEIDNPSSIAQKYILVGAGPRAIQALFLAAKARALLEGRFNVAFEDVDAVAAPILRHRLILNFDAVTENISIEDVIQMIMSECRDGL